MLTILLMIAVFRTQAQDRPNNHHTQKQVALLKKTREKNDLLTYLIETNMFKVTLVAFLNDTSFLLSLTELTLNKLQPVTLGLGQSSCRYRQHRIKQTDRFLSFCPTSGRVSTL